MTPESSGGGARVAEILAEADRCPYPRPFSPDFRECPAFQAVGFHASDSMGRPLRAGVTCRHLATGADSELSGRYYPRCGIGDAGARRAWTALANPAKLEVVRAIQEEFDQFSWEHRERLLDAKRRLQASPGEAHLRAELDRLLESFLDVMGGFLEERAARLEDVGLPVSSLKQLIEAWSRAWVSNRHPKYIRRPDRMAEFDPVSQAFDSRLKLSKDRRRATTVFDDGRLRIARVQRSGQLRMQGELDASNAEPAARALAGTIATGGDVEVDCSGLLFCDVGGMRALVRTAQGLGDGRRLVVRGITPPLRRALRLVGWAELSALTIADEASA